MKFQKSGLRGLEKAPTGIQGLDDITAGGLPRGRTTIVCGTAGCGKTLLGVEFLVRGAVQFNEPGVLITFEESSDELAQNVASLGFDLKALIRKKKLFIDHINVERSQLEEAGEYDLEALFIRLQSAIEEVGAKRVLIDTLESIFSVFNNEAVLRSEIRRLFVWLKERGMTAVVTAERGTGTLTRHGLEEYVSDCVILLDHRVNEQSSTRRLRVVKYRGTTHGADEYPFLIDEDGFSVLPSSAMKLASTASRQRVSSGIPRLDTILGGKGYYRGSTILLSGTAGAGKTSVAASFMDAACKRGERCLFFSFEESPSQLARNMQSIGINLERWMRAGLLKIEASRPHLYGAEMHLVRIHKLVESFNPKIVVVDPVTCFNSIATASEINSMLMRLMDFLKNRQITTMLTSLTEGGSATDSTDVAVSSMIDTWLLLRNIEANGERNRGLYILKSRGMAHSNQIREFVLTSHGVELLDVYTGTGEMLTGSARMAQEARERNETAARRHELKSLNDALRRRKKSVEAQVAALWEAFDSEMGEAKRKLAQLGVQENAIESDRGKMASLRGADRKTK